MMKFKVFATHPASSMPDYSKTPLEVRVSEHGGLFSASARGLGCGKDHITAEEAIKELLGDHAYRIQKTFKVFPVSDHQRVFDQELLKLDDDGIGISAGYALREAMEELQKYMEFKDADKIYDRIWMIVTDEIIAARRAAQVRSEP